MVPKTVSNPTRIPAKTLPTGFRAQLGGASIWDLVQIECLARHHRVARVTTPGNIGYLYFDQGNIVHASTFELEGEAAAFEMLQWTQGTFEPCDRPWPPVCSISAPWQSLLLRAAQLKDEHDRKVVALPSKERSIEDEPAPVTAESPMSNKVRNGTSGMNLEADDYEVAVRLGENGEVLASRGPAEEFANTVAYVSRLVEIVGTVMGLEGFKGLECNFKSGRCFILKEPDGSLLALKPIANADVSLVKDRIGL
jgi:Domain of unknown function (DUF4388)